MMVEREKPRRRESTGPIRGPVQKLVPPDNFARLVLLLDSRFNGGSGLWEAKVDTKNRLLTYIEFRSRSLLGPVAQPIIATIVIDRSTDPFTFKFLRDPIPVSGKHKRYQR